MPEVTSCDTCFLRDLCKCAVTVIAEKFVGSEIRDQQIGETVIIDIGRSATLTPSASCQPGLSSHVREFSAAIVAVQVIPLPARLAGFKIFNGRAIHDKQIYQPVVVVIQPTNTSSVDIEDRLLLRRSVDRYSLDASLFGYIDEARFTASLFWSQPTLSGRELRTMRLCRPCFGH